MGSRAVPRPLTRMRSDAVQAAGGHAVFPVVTSPEGWIAKATGFNPLCKCCDPRGSEQILRWLILRALQQPYEGRRVSLPAMNEWLASECGVECSYEGMKNHVKNHVQLTFIKPEFGVTAPVARVERIEQQLIKVSPEQRIAEVRAEVQKRRVASTEPDHIGYLQSVVGIAQAVIEANPERVTPEMGLRAAAELSRIKASAERDRMLEILARSARPPEPAQLDGAVTVEVVDG
jgi:hypothetical protein